MRNRTANAAASAFSSSSVYSRRTFIKAASAASGGLMLGCYVSPQLSGTSGTAFAAGTFEPNVWIKLSADDSVRIMLTMLEMGQGVMTSMPMLVAEELDFDWSKIKTEWAPADSRYGNPNFGGQQLTAGSNSVRGMWKLMRESGAAARLMLVSAAAQTWNVPASTCTTDKGEVFHQASGRRLKYGALVDKAAALPVPTNITLKAPGSFKVLGTSVPRLDTPAKVNGTAEFGIDVKLPGRRPLPSLWRQGREFQRRQSQSGAWRVARRADQHGRGGRGGQLLVGVARRAGARGEVGRGPACYAHERGHHEEVRGAGAAARQGRAERRQRGPGACGRKRRPPPVRASVRGALPRARVHGADELHGRRAGRRL
jgi:hypothetical protein